MGGTMKAIVLGASALLLAANLSACATVTRGTTTTFNVVSTPPGASVKTSTGFSCDATPCGFKVPRKNEFDVTIAKVGYAPKVLHVRSAIAGGGAAGMAGNILLGGVIGMAVDGTNGSMNDLTPNPMTVTLDPDAAPPAADAAMPAAPAMAPAPAAPAVPTTAPKP
jgi:hypothetical protein